MSYLCSAKHKERDVAQLVAHTSGGREVASSSLVIPTKKGEHAVLLFWFVSRIWETNNKGKGNIIMNCDYEL